MEYPVVLFHPEQKGNNHDIDNKLNNLSHLAGSAHTSALSLSLCVYLYDSNMHSFAGIYFMIIVHTMFGLIYHDLST